MKERFKKGDAVRWDTPQGETEGIIIEKLTSRTMIGAHVVAASEDHPEYLVRSSKSGKLAAHRPQELRKARRKE